MTIFKEICKLPEFERNLKKLLKRFKTLKKDIKIFVEKQLHLYHKQKIDNKGVFPLTGLQRETPKIYKAKKFACRSLPGTGVQSGIRVIYAYYEDVDKIVLIEIYYKGDKANEDRERIKDNLDSCIS